MTVDGQAETLDWPASVSNKGSSQVCDNPSPIDDEWSLCQKSSLSGEFSVFKKRILHFRLVWVHSF
jgi:hypothetical protein